MKKTLTIINMLVAVLWAVACTSSNSATTVSTNSGYDSQYRENSRSSQNYQQTQEPGAPEGDPPITLMMLGMETGQVHPGEDYFVYAIVDNPDDRDIEYEWSVSNGSILDVPEAERGRLITLVEQDKATALAGGFASGAAAVIPEAPPAGEAAAPPVEGTAPAASTPSAPGSSAPGGAAQAAPAARPNTGTGVQAPASAPPGAAKPSGVSGNTGGGSPVSTGVIQDDVNPEEVNPEELENQEREEIADEPKEEEVKTAALSTGSKAMLLERRIVSGPEDSSDEDPSEDSEEAEMPAGESVTPESAEDSSQGATETSSELSSSAHSAVQAARAALAELNEVGSTSGTGNVAVEASPKANYGEESYTASRGVYAGDDELRTEYRTWQDVSGTQRRRPLGSAIPEAAAGPVMPEDSFEEYSFVTDEPYILWTPRTEGELTIYMRAKYKDEVVTEIVELPVTVELREPTLTLSDEFPDLIHEDDNVIVRILGENIPEFFKGLITLTYDVNALSFRNAELGEFFDDAPDAKLFDAQPDKTQGKLLLALDANTEITQLSGTDPIVYLKFKAKQDITGQEQTQLAIVKDTSASYILDYNGDNILPVPIERPVYRSIVTQPPALETYPRQTPEGTPATGATGQQATTPGQRPGNINQNARPNVGQNTGINNSTNTGNQQSNTEKSGGDSLARSQSSSQENVGPVMTPEEKAEQLGINPEELENVQEGELGEEPEDTREQKENPANPETEAQAG